MRPHHTDGLLCFEWPFISLLPAQPWWRRQLVSPKGLAWALPGWQVIFPLVFVFFCNSHLSPVRCVSFLSSEREHNVFNPCRCSRGTAVPWGHLPGSVPYHCLGERGCFSTRLLRTFEAWLFFVGARQGGCPVHSMVFSSSGSVTPPT